MLVSDLNTWSDKIQRRQSLTEAHDNAANMDLDLLITNVQRKQATPEEQARYEDLFERDASFRERVAEVKRWLDPLENATAAPLPRDTLLKNLLDEIDQLPQDGSGSGETEIS